MASLENTRWRQLLATKHTHTQRAIKRLTNLIAHPKSIVSWCAFYTYINETCTTTQMFVNAFNGLTRYLCFGAENTVRCDFVSSSPLTLSLINNQKISRARIKLQSTMRWAGRKIKIKTNTRRTCVCRHCDHFSERNKNPKNR